MASDSVTKAGLYAERLLDNEYVQENLTQAVDSLRAAYRRASKRRAGPTRDKKLRRHLRQTALSIREATSALKTGRRKPKPRWGRRLVVVLAVGTGGAAALVVAKRKVRGNDSERSPQLTPTAGAEVSSVA